MQPKPLLSFAGFAVFMAAAWCPLLKPFGLIKWNAYDLNKPYGMVLLLVAIVGIAGIVLKQYQVSRTAAWAGLILVILLYIAAQLKVNTTFSFIPFKSMAGFLTKLIKFQWGWYPLFAGPLVSAFTTPKNHVLPQAKGLQQ